MKNAKRIALILLAFIVASAASAGATSVMKLDTDALFTGADLIVAGTVTQLQSRKIEGAATPVVTDAVIKIEMTLKGEAADAVTVRIPGGKVGEFGLMVPGSPVLEKGDRILLSLEKGKKDFYRIRGFHQGRFSLIENPENGKTVAVQDPFRKIAGKSEMCESEETDCPMSDPVKFTLDEIRRIVGKKP